MHEGFSIPLLFNGSYMEFMKKLYVLFTSLGILFSGKCLSLCVLPTNHIVHFVEVQSFNIYQIQKTLTKRRKEKIINHELVLKTSFVGF